jgi:hypothetical protein
VSENTDDEKIDSQASVNASVTPAPATWAFLVVPLLHLNYSVRRAKAQFFSACNSHPATFAPAGSNRSGSGGNKNVRGAL